MWTPRRVLVIARALTQAPHGNQALAGPAPDGRWRGNRKVVKAMASCSEMKAGEVYVCENCDLEIQVVHSCAESEEGACAWAESLSCCGGPLVLKQ
jgi:hypothetical protein